MSASDLRLDVVTDDDGFAALRGEWADAAAADADPNVFLTWPWASTWWRHFGARDRVDGDEPRRETDLHIVVVRDHLGVVGIAPLYRERLGGGLLGMTVLRRLNHDAGDYGGMVLARRAEAAVKLLVDHLAAQLRRDVSVVVLSRLASDARFTRLLGDELVRHAATVETVVHPIGDACLYTDVRGGFDLAAQAKRHKIAQRLRRLGEQHGEVAFVDHTGDTLEDGLDRLVALHQRRWDALDAPMQGLLAVDAQREFLLDAARALDADGMLALRSLEAGGRPVAVELDFVHQRRLFLFKGAFDPAYAAFSPGQLLFHTVFAEGLAAGIEVFDFCRGDAPYKRRWTNRERHISTVTLSRPGLAGALARQRFRVLDAADRRLRPGRQWPGPPWQGRALPPRPWQGRRTAGGPRSRRSWPRRPQAHRPR